MARQPRQPHQPAMTQVVQIVPALAGGVADHADALCRQWATMDSGEADALRATPEAGPVWALDEAAVRELPLARRLSAMGIGQAFAADGPGRISVLLHFSGYGYHARGLCHWLLHELRAARRACGTRLRIVVMFHELFALGEPPWRSAFWLSPWQRAIAADLARLADVIVTNTQQHAAWLQRAAPRAQVHAWPVFSNVGEGGPGVARAEREPVLLVFGSASTRQRALRALCRLDPRGEVLQALGVHEVLEVGPAVGLGPGHAGQPLPVPMRALGRLDGPELAATLARCRFGLIEYPSRYLGKSSVFAAYAAHGCAVLNVARSGPAGETFDGLTAGRHYLRLDEAGSVSADRVASDAWHWYAAHRLTHQARAFLGLLRPTTRAAAPPPAAAGGMIRSAH